MPAVEPYRLYIQALARRQVDDRLAGKLDLSVVVQHTMLEAHTVAEWDEWSDAQRKGWLRTALSRNLCDEVRKFTAAARDVDRECSIEQRAAAGETARDWLAADHSTPSECAGRNERLARLTAVLQTLPDDQRRAVELHHLAGRPLAEVAAEMGKTVQSVVGLLFRGMRRLRELMPEE